MNDFARVSQNHLRLFTFSIEKENTDVTKTLFFFFKSDFFRQECRLIILNAVACAALKKLIKALYSVVFED